MLCHLSLDTYTSSITRAGTIFPSIQAVRVGETVRMVCHSMTPVTWVKAKKTLRNYSNESNILVIPNVKLKQSGIYECHGTSGSPAEEFTLHSILLVGGN